MSLTERRRDRRRKPNIDSTPLIDCAFTLLIFFAVSTTLISTRAGIDVNLPGAATAEAKPVNVQISIREDRGVYFEDMAADGPALQMMVEKKIEEEPTASFIINADKTVPYEKLVGVLDIVRSAGAERIALAAEKAEKENSGTAGYGDPALQPNETEEE